MRPKDQQILIDDVVGRRVLFCDTAPTTTLMSAGRSTLRCFSLSLH